MTTSNHTETILLDNDTLRQLGGQGNRGSEDKGTEWGTRGQDNKTRGRDDEVTAEGNKGMRGQQTTNNEKDKGDEGEG